jgi:hypothetical protein
MMARALCPPLRSLFENETPYFSSQIVNVIGKFGNFDDIGNIVSMCGNFKYFDLPILGIPDRRANFELAARAIVKISDARFADIISMPMPSELRSQVIKFIPVAKFRLLEDEQLKTLLNDEDDDVRKSTALRCVLVLGAGRVRSLIEKCTKEGLIYYYNIVFWTDLVNISDPDTRKLVARDELTTV